MKVFGNPLSPFVRKVLVFAAEKQLAIELVPASMGQGGPEFAKASPLGKMPGFCDGDYYLADSSAICTYVDAAYPAHNLIPADPKLRGRTVWFDEFGDTVLMASAGKIFFNRMVAPRFLGRPGDEEIAKLGESELPRLYDYLETVITPSGFLVDSRLTLADISIATGFVNLEHVGITVDGSAYPKLKAYLDAIHARPSFAKWIAIEKQSLQAK